MKKLVLLIMALLLVAGAGFAAEKALKAKAGTYDVELVFGKTPTTGEVPLTVLINEAGKTATDAKVTVVYYRTEKVSGKGKSLEMRYHKSEAETKADTSGYIGKADFSMVGRWHVKAKIEKGDKA